MSATFYNISYGTGMEGVVNYANAITNWWFVPMFLLFIFIAISVTMSKREDKAYPMSAIVGYALVVVLIGAIIFKLMTSVSEYFIYIIAIALGLAIAWGIWQNR